MGEIDRVSRYRFATRKCWHVPNGTLERGDGCENLRTQWTRGSGLMAFWACAPQSINTRPGRRAANRRITPPTKRSQPILEWDAAAPRLTVRVVFSNRTPSRAHFFQATVAAHPCLGITVLDGRQDIPKTRGRRHVRAHAKRKSVRLAGVVIWVLADDNHAHLVGGAITSPRKHILPRRQHLFGLAPTIIFGQEVGG